MEMYMVLFIIISGIFSFLSMRKHVLMMLLSIEYIMLGIFFSLILSVVGFMGEVYFFMVYLSFVACEGALGLSIFVLLSRSSGNDFLFGLNLLKC